MTIPDFPIAVCARDGGGEGSGAIVVVRGKGSRAEVVCLSPGARRLGLRPGMRVTEARGRAPDLVVRGWDDRLYARAEGECAAALLAASPRVARAGAVGVGAFWLEVGGWVRRGGEGVFAEVARGAILALGYPEARVGIADSAAAAWAASRLAGKKRVVRVPPAGDARFLSPLPIRSLPLSDALHETLAALGVERVAELVRLGCGDAAAVEARLGAEGLRAWRWAQGRDERRPFRRPSERGHEVSVELGGVDRLEPFLFILKACLDRMAADLGRRGECARGLALVLECEGGAEVVHRLTPARPTRSARTYLDLARASLEGGMLPAPAVGLTVRAEETAPAGAEQGDLFERRWVDPLAWSVGHARLVARWGADAVVRPEPRDTHRPEAAGRWVPVRPADAGGTGPVRGAGSDGRGARPAGGPPLPPLPPGPSPALVLHRFPEPVPIAVRAREGRPATVRVDGRWRRVESCLGPERISGEWWGDPYRREYYRVLAGGGWLWIFRDARVGRAWWWHGWWD